MSRSFTREETRRLASILADTAQAEVMPRFRNLPEGAVRGKTSVRDLVTDADEAAERMISARLAVYPGAVLIGEEASTRNPAVEHAGRRRPGLPDRPHRRHPQLRGGPAAVRHDDRRRHRGDVIAGVIYDPVSRDSALAVRGEGAWMEYENGKQAPLAVASPAPPEDMDGLISTGALPEPLRSTVNGNLRNWAARLAALRGP